MVRRGGEVWVYSTSLGEVGMDRLNRQIGDAGALVGEQVERVIAREGVFRDPKDVGCFAAYVDPA